MTPELDPELREWLASAAHIAAAFGLVLACALPQILR